MTAKKKKKIKVRKTKVKQDVEHADTSEPPRLPKWKSRSVALAFLVMFAAIIMLLTCGSTT